MARLEIIGKVKEVGNVEAIPTYSGSYEKRELVLDCSYYDSITGEKREENYVKFEFGGKNVDVPKPFAVGEIVKVAFALRGRYYTPKGGTEQKVITSIIGYDIEKYVRQNAQNSQSQAQTNAAPTQPQEGAESESQEDPNKDLPF